MTLPSCPSVVFGGGPPVQPPPPIVPSTTVSQQQQLSATAVSPVLYPVVYVSPAGLLTVLMRYVIHQSYPSADSVPMQWAQFAPNEK